MTDPRLTIEPLLRATMSGSTACAQKNEPFRVTSTSRSHRARDLTPHGSPHVTVRHDGVHFIPDDDLFGGLRLQPPIQRGANEHPLQSLRSATAERGIALSGWTVFCHNTTLGEANPDCTTENAFGERGSPADLCPSHPDVRAYALALARNVARLGVDEVVAESLHFGTFEHGYHHERSHYDEKELSSLLVSIASINVWNRLNAATRQPVGVAS